MMDCVDIDTMSLLHGERENDENSGFKFSHSSLQRTKKIRCYDNFNYLDDLLDDNDETSK